MYLQHQKKLVTKIKYLSFSLKNVEINLKSPTPDQAGKPWIQRGFSSAYFPSVMPSKVPGLSTL